MESKQAFNEFLEVLKDADQTFLDPEANLDEQGKVDGYQHFFHLLHAAIDFYLFNDPLKPRFMPLTNSGRKLFGDNVDAVYYFTQLPGDQEYVIQGRRFDSCYLSFCIYGGDPHGELADRVTLNINHRDIQFGKDSSFEIRLCPDPDPGNPNEFKLEPDSVNMFTREYFFDRPSSTESELSIVNTNPQPPAVPSEDGSVEVILSHQETPGNWMSTAGYREGVLFCRWLLAEKMPEPPVISVSKW